MPVDEMLFYMAITPVGTEESRVKFARVSWSCLEKEERNWNRNVAIWCML